MLDLILNNYEIDCCYQIRFRVKTQIGIQYIPITKQTNLKVFFANKASVMCLINLGKRKQS